LHELRKTKQVNEDDKINEKDEKDVRTTYKKKIKEEVNIMILLFLL